MRTIFRSLTGALVLLTAVILVMNTAPSRADAAPARSAAPLLSSRSAILPASGGLLQLGHAGQPTRSAQRATQQLNEYGQIWDSSWEVAKQMCGAMGSSGSSGSSGIAGAIVDGAMSLIPGGSLLTGDGLLEMVCKPLLTGVLFVVRQVGGLLVQAWQSFIAPIAKGTVTMALSLALGFNPFDNKCLDGTQALANSSCNGQDSAARVLQVRGTKSAGIMLTLSIIMAMPLLLAAIITALIKQSMKELGKTLVRLPFVWILSAAAIVIVSVGVGFRDGIVTFIIGQTDMVANINTFFTPATAPSAAMGTFSVDYVSWVIAIFASMIGSIILFVLLLVGDGIILCSVLFVPLATVGLLWGGTAKWLKRLSELTFGFIMGKIVIVASLAMILELLASNKS